MSLLKTVGAMVCAIVLFATSSFAADESKPAWKKSLMVDITTTQTSYSDSWVGGEAGSVNWVGNLNGSAEKQLKEWFNFKSTLKLSFGQTMTQGADSVKHWSKPKKSTDLIDWENVGRFTLQKSVDPFAAFRLESQFLDASVEAKKRFFTPIKLTESVGIARQFYAQEKDEVISRLGLALRQIMKNTIVDEQLNTEDSTLIDGGIESVTDVTLTFNERLRYTGKLTLYKALYFSNKDEVKGTEFEDDWKAIDVNWENIISASLSKIVTVNLYAQLLYDKEVSRKGRFKETLAIGFVFKML
ncbi:MAG: DUF3078 domain-containing protein [Candidatus Zixiibacteriota bacterium]|nr:MAG: DUF3078 domain-containing protein [candidate division Zixibacteria bacterium]